MNPATLSYLDSVPVLLMRSEHIGIRKLRGFQKSHRVPDSYDERAKKFIGQVAREDTESIVQNIFQSVRKVLGLRRKEINVFIDDDGSGFLEAAWFRYVISFRPLDGSCETLVRLETVELLKDKNVLLDPEFAQVFGKRFQKIQINLPFSIEVDSLIDQLEEIDDDRFTIDYQWDAESCRISLADSNSFLEVFSESIHLGSTLSQETECLVHGVVEYQTVLESALSFST